MTSRSASVRRFSSGFALALITILVASACSTTVINPTSAAAVAPQLTVERFLQAANARDLDAMSRIFGTARGPVGDTGSTFGCFWKKLGTLFGGRGCVQRSEVEVRLDAIARVLQHRDYQITGQEPVAGRSAPTRRLFVSMRLDGDVSVNQVPFVVVQGGEQRWYVEEVGLERILSAGGV